MMTEDRYTMYIYFPFIYVHTMEYTLNYESLESVRWSKERKSSIISLLNTAQTFMIHQDKLRNGRNRKTINFEELNKCHSVESAHSEIGDGFAPFGWRNIFAIWSSLHSSSHLLMVALVLCDGWSVNCYYLNIVLDVESFCFSVILVTQITYQPGEVTNVSLLENCILSWQRSKNWLLSVES